MFSGKSGWRGLGIYLAAVGVVTLAVEFPFNRTVGWLLLMLQLMAPSFAPGMAQRIAAFAMRSGSATVFFELLLPSFAPAIAWLLARSLTGEWFISNPGQTRREPAADRMVVPGSPGTCCLWNGMAHWRYAVRAGSRMVSLRILGSGDVAGHLGEGD